MTDGGSQGKRIQDTRDPLPPSHQQLPNPPQVGKEGLAGERSLQAVGSKGQRARNTKGGFRPDPGGRRPIQRAQHPLASAPAPRLSPATCPAQSRPVPSDPSWGPAPRINNEVYRGRPARSSPALLVFKVAVRKSSTCHRRELGPPKDLFPGIWA